MAEADIRAAIKSILENIPEIGKVYDYEVHSADWKTFLNFFKSTIGDHEEIRGWEVFRTGPVADDDDQVRSHTYKIRGYMALADNGASGKTFASLVESVQNIFRLQENAKLNNTCIGAGFLRVVYLEPRSFGGALCHFMEATMTVREEM